VLRNTENFESAEVSLNRMVAMQGHLVESGQNTTDAMSAINQLVKVRDAAEVQVAKIDNAYDAVQKFGELKNQIMTNGEGLDIAQEHVAALAAIKNDVFNEAGDVAAAHEAARNMIALKNDINEKSEGLETAKLTAQELFTLKDAVVSNGGNTEAAFANTERLFTLRDALIAEADLDSAEGNLTQLVEIQDTLNRQTAEVADAVETLEVLTDLNDELQTQVTTIDGMRKSLLDVVLMESTVRKVAGILEPLAELSNLRRLSNDDMREAARVIMDQRTSRVASRPALSTSKSAPKLELNDVELFTDEQPKDIFVPLPKDLDIDSVIDSIE
jgi:hypothetical protein